jgi:hypothetical protein
MYEANSSDVDSWTPAPVFAARTRIYEHTGYDVPSRTQIRSVIVCRLAKPENKDGE